MTVISGALANQLDGMAEDVREQAIASHAARAAAYWMTRVRA